MTRSAPRRLVALLVGFEAPGIVLAVVRLMVSRDLTPATAWMTAMAVLGGATFLWELANQIRRVLRLRLGERVTLLDGQGFAYEAILIALGFAGAVGMFFGYYPARKASRLDPIESLRAE
mgnify:CR=1 FL=1